MLKLRYISGDDPENENSKNKRKVKGIWLKKQRKQKRLFPKARKSIKKKHKKKKVLLKVSVVFLLLVVIGWFTFGAKVMKLRSEAKIGRASCRERVCQYV